MKNIEIIQSYTAGELTLEEAKAALLEIGDDTVLDAEAITADEAGRFGLLDTGTGSLDKVEVRDMELLHPIGPMKGVCFLDGKAYDVVDGAALVEKEG